MAIKSMPVWKWALLLVASFILALLIDSASELAVDVVKPVLLNWLVAVAVSAAMVALYMVFVRWFERQPAKDIPIRKLAGDTAKGFGVGTCFFVMVVAVMSALGLYKIMNIGLDPALGIISSLFLFLVVATGEEIMFRGVLFRWIDEKWGFAAALIVSAVLFGALHLLQPNATWWSSLAIAIEAGLLLGAAYKMSGTLWFPIGIHWAWNFFQGNIFGFAVSGTDAGNSLIHSSVSGPDILTGGLFGAEASIITVVLGAALSAWFIFRVYKKAETTDR